MEIIFIPTFKCDGECDYCFIDTLKYDRSVEIDYDFKLKSILNQFESISMTGGEPFLYTRFFDVVKDYENLYVNTNFYADDKLIQQSISINPKIKFGVSFHAKSHFGRPKETDDLYEKILKYQKYIKKIKYVIFIRNYQNFESDLSLLKSTSIFTEFIPFFGSRDLEYVENLSERERENLKHNLVKMYNEVETYSRNKMKNFFEKHHKISAKQTNYIGPYDCFIYNERQAQKKNCDECYSIGHSSDVCQHCVQYTESIEFSEACKERYIKAFERFKLLLNI